MYRDTVAKNTISVYFLYRNKNSFLCNLTGHSLFEVEGFETPCFRSIDIETTSMTQICCTRFVRRQFMTIYDL